jgi:hypothetical protein
MWRENGISVALRAVRITAPPVNMSNGDLEEGCTGCFIAGGDHTAEACRPVGLARPNK